MKVVAQAKNCKEIEVGGKIHRAKDGIFDIPERAARYTVGLEGGQWPTLGPHASSAIGFRCPECDFGSFFARCSRCGAKCAREAR